MIDRRQFANDDALGAASSVRPSALLASQNSTELGDLADAALAAARKVGASYRIPHQPLTACSSSSPATVAVPNIATPRLRIWRARGRRRHVGFASSNVVTKDEIARVNAQAAGHRQGESENQRRAG